MITRGRSTRTGAPHAADTHDREALLHDELAAATNGWLHIGFLHAAEAHRAAARQERALTDGE